MYERTADLATVPHTEGTARSGDVEIFYRRFGRPGETPVLIVHGLSYFSYDWIGPAGALATDREVVAIDMRGFGRSSSSPTRDYKLESMSADVIAVLDALGWPTAVLVGHSFGGRVALATAGWRPERVAGLVLVDFAPDVAAAGRRHTAERIGGQPDEFASVDAALAWAGYHDVPADSSVRRRWEAFLRPTGHGFTLRRDLAFRDSFRRTLESGQSPPVPAYLWTFLSELAVPGMVIRASRSDMLTAETLAEAGAKNPRLATLELEGSHDLAGDNPTDLVAAIRRLLAQVG